MATSLISGLLASGFEPEQIWVSDTNPETLAFHKQNLHINVTDNNLTLCSLVDVLVLAVKPQIIREVCLQIASLILEKKLLVVSIAAGITQSSLAQWIGASTPVVRCMPNTPALVLTGATALHANVNVNTQQKDLSESILRAVGITLWIDDEKKLDAVTAVSGSGPAYYFLMMEAMEQAAQDLGLDEKTAHLLVLQTALGAAKIALESTETPSQLRERVTSPGGTTQKAIETFQQNGFNALVNKALHAARDRSIEMSKQLGAD